MIAFIKTPIQGVFILCRKLCVHASLYAHTHTPFIHVTNDEVIELNDAFFDFNEKSSPSKAQTLSSKTPLLSIYTHTHDKLTVIKGVFYALKEPLCVYKRGLRVSYAPINVLNDIFYVTKALLHVIKDAIYETNEGSMRSMKGAYVMPNVRSERHIRGGTVGRGWL